MDVLDREQYSQSAPLTANHVRDACGNRRFPQRQQRTTFATPNQVRRSERGSPHCERRSPDPDLNRHEPSEKKNPGADAPVVFFSDKSKHDDDEKPPLH